MTFFASKNHIEKASHLGAIQLKKSRLRVGGLVCVVSQLVTIPIVLLAFFSLYFAFSEGL